MKTSDSIRLPHSEDLHIVERLHRTGPDTMESRVLIDDPKTFTKPWSMIHRFKRVPGMTIREYIRDNNRNNADANRHTGVQLQGS